MRHFPFARNFFASDVHPKAGVTILCFPSKEARDRFVRVAPDLRKPLPSDRMARPGTPGGPVDCRDHPEFVEGEAWAAGVREDRQDQVFVITEVYGITPEAQAEGRYTCRLVVVAPSREALDFLYAPGELHRSVAGRPVPGPAASDECYRRVTRLGPCDMSPDEAAYHRLEEHGSVWVVALHGT